MCVRAPIPTKRRTTIGILKKRAAKQTKKRLPFIYVQISSLFCIIMICPTQTDWISSSAHGSGPWICVCKCMVFFSPRIRKWRLYYMVRCCRMLADLFSSPYTSSSLSWFVLPLCFFLLLLLFMMVIVGVCDVVDWYTLTDCFLTDLSDWRCLWMCKWWLYKDRLRFVV